MSLAESPAAESRPAEPGTENQMENNGSVAHKRFDIFVIDVGWNSPISESFRTNLKHALPYQQNCNSYFLSAKQCFVLARLHPSMLGVEPSMIVIDREAYAARRPEGYGFKLNLGMVRDVRAANNLVKWILAVLAEQKPGSDVTRPIQKLIHKEGLRGAINIMAEMAHSTAGGGHH
jgi:hypothetical protein